MPSKNTLCFPFFNLTQHKIELRASGRFGRAAFFKGANDGQAFSLGKFIQFEKLRLNGQYLAVALVGGLADIHKENVRLHVVIITCDTRAV